MIKFNETELTGNWILKDGTLIEDEVSMRIKFLIANKLTEISTDSTGWRKLYKDPNDNRYWELSYPHSDLQGGGPPLLKNLSENEARSIYDF